MICSHLLFHSVNEPLQTRKAGAEVSEDVISSALPSLSPDRRSDQNAAVALLEAAGDALSEVRGDVWRRHLHLQHRGVRFGKGKGKGKGKAHTHFTHMHIHIHFCLLACVRLVVDCRRASMRLRPLQSALFCLVATALQV